jgi:hypothetical protein
MAGLATTLLPIHPSAAAELAWFRFGCRWKPLEDDDTVQPTLVRMPKNKYPIMPTAL